MRHLQIIFTIILTHLIGFTALGQFDANLKYGLNSSSVITHDAVDALDGIKVPIQSHFIEGTVGYDIDESFNISTGLNYRVKGFGLDYTIDQNIFGFNVPLGVRAELNVKALSVPIKLKYRLPIDGIDTYAFAGGGYSFHINPEIRTTANVIGEIDLTNFQANNLVNDGEAFGHVGLGAAVPWGPGKFFGEATYEQSFQNYTSDLILDIPLKNRGFTVGVGYSMPF